MNSIKRQKDRTLKDELPMSVGAQYTTGDQWGNNSRKNEETEPKRKQRPVVDVTRDGSKEQWSTGIWNVRFMKLVLDRKAWHTAVHGVTKSRTQLSD